MKTFLTSLFAVFVFVLIVSEANAQFAKAVVNPPGLFNRTVVRARGPGASVAVAGGGGRNVAAAASVGGFVPVQAQAAVAFGGVRTAFVPQVAVANVGFPANVAFASPQVLFVNQNRVRFNSFGVSTVQDGFGNVFEVDAFGNSRFAGNRLGSAAVVTGFVPTASSVVVQGGGFATFRSSGICGFH